MDIVDLLLLGFFVGLPILRFILERLGAGKDEESPTPEEEEWERPRVPAPARTPAPAPPKLERIEAAGGERGWSEGWGAWPAETLEELTAEEVVSEEEADELLALQERAPLRESSEAARVTLPVVSLENVEVDRRAEHRRFHALTVPVVQRARPRPAAALERTLHTRDDLRRALLLSEILGPPRALQEPIPHQPG